MAMETVKSADTTESELDEPLWSVISFERCEAAGLTYADAVKRLAELEKRHVNGLCIVTDDAATRIGSRG